ncbi:MAG: Ig-like domain-containing protein [Ruminococcus sp.]|nr:Ig-like domain-containing protein [Ruminococcus sp.]
MDNNTESRPRRRRVTKKMLRQRQLGALAIIALLILIFIVLIFKGCSNSGESGKGSKHNATTTTTAAVTTAAPVTTVATTTANPLAAQVVLSKREMFIQNVGDQDISYISGYPEGSSEANEVWKSLDESIATVDGYGHVTAVAPGETYVILSFDNNPGIEVEIKVHVADGSGVGGLGGAAPETPTETPADGAIVSFTTPAEPFNDDSTV